MTRTFDTLARRAAALAVLTLALLAGQVAGASGQRRPQGRLLRLPNAQTITAGVGSIWVTTSHEIVRIDPRTDTMIARIPLPGATRPVFPGGMAVDGHLLWVTVTPISTSPTSSLPSALWSIDTRTDQVVGAPIPLQLAGGTGIAAAAGSLWITNNSHGQFGRLYQVSASRRKLVRALRIPNAPASVVASEGKLWVGESDNGKIVRVDPITGTIAGNPIKTGGALLTLAADRSRLWVADSYKGRLLAINTASGKQTSEHPLAGIWNVIAAGGSVWAVLGRTGELIKIDPMTNAPSGVPRPILGGAEGGLNSGGYLWLFNPHGVARVDP
jgi:streptogramin lyase